MWRIIRYFFVFLLNIKTLAGNIDFSSIHDLNNENKIYAYPINFSFGVLMNNLPIFTCKKETQKSRDMVLKDVFGLGGEVKFSWVITNMFCAKILGFFPKIGVLIQGFSMNYGREFLLSCGRFFVSCLKASPKWNFVPKESNFNINILGVVEPETNMFQQNRLVPQIGIGVSVINLYHDFDVGSKVRISPLWVDVCFLHKVLLVKKTSLCDIELSCGYTYNPLLGLLFYSGGVKQNIVGGIMNLFGGVAFSFYNNLGLESIDWFDEDFKKVKYYKKQCCIDVFYGVGKWYNFIDSSSCTNNIYSQLLISCSYPYMLKMMDNFFYGLGIDISEDIRNSIDKKDANLASLVLNNFNLVFNFLQLSLVYKTIRISHNLGVYILTNLYNTFQDPINIVNFGQREINNIPNYSTDDYIKWFDYFTGRVTYRPRIYINIFKMIRKRAKFSCLDKCIFVLGLNTILFNHRNDLQTKPNRNGKTSSNIEFVKIEGFFVGVSIEI